MPKRFNYAPSKFNLPRDKKRGFITDDGRKRYYLKTEESDHERIKNEFSKQYAIKWDSVVKMWYSFSKPKIIGILRDGYKGEIHGFLVSKVLSARAVKAWHKEVREKTAKPKLSKEELKAKRNKAAYNKKMNEIARSFRNHNHGFTEKQMQFFQKTVQTV